MNPLLVLRRAPIGIAIVVRLLSLWTGVGRALAGAEEGQRPNVVWILVDDMSPNLSCLGDISVRTPNLDGLARRGVLFRRAFVTGPICSISRSALVTGCYQTRLGCQNHRSDSVANPIRLPRGIQLIPELMKSGGYHVSNVGFDDFMRAGGAVGVAKTDYNFEWDRNGLTCSMGVRRADVETLVRRFG